MRHPSEQYESQITSSLLINKSFNPFERLAALLPSSWVIRLMCPYPNELTWGDTYPVIHFVEANSRRKVLFSCLLLTKVTSSCLLRVLGSHLTCYYRLSCKLTPDSGSSRGARTTARSLTHAQIWQHCGWVAVGGSVRGRGVELNFKKAPRRTIWRSLLALIGNELMLHSNALCILQNASSFDKNKENRITRTLIKVEEHSEREYSVFSSLLGNDDFHLNSKNIIINTLWKCTLFHLWCLLFLLNTKKPQQPQLLMSNI